MDAPTKTLKGNLGGLSVELCAAAAAIRYEDLPAEVIRTAKLLILDTFGIIGAAKDAVTAWESPDTEEPYIDSTIMDLARTIFKHAQPKELPAKEAKRIREVLEELAMGRPSIREDLQAQGAGFVKTNVQNQDAS